MDELEMGDETVRFWNDLTKTDTINGREVPVYISANRVLDEAKKQGINLERIKNTVGKPTEAPDYNTIVEKLGYAPDKGIADLVWLFNSMGVYTSQSCEGHPDEHHGSPNPLVAFSDNMALKALVTIEGWKGTKTGDIVFSRMISNEFGEKNLVEMDFMDKSLVNDLAKHIEKGIHS